MKNDLARSITRSQTQSSSIRTKGKIIDAQYEMSICRTTVDGPDTDTAQTGVDGLLIRPGFTKSQWLTCQ